MPPSEAQRHLAEAAEAMVSNWFATSAPTTVRAAWSGIAGDPGEDAGRGLGKVWLVLCGVLRALVLTLLYAAGLACSTRRRTGGVVIITGLLIATYYTTRALLP